MQRIREIDFNKVGPKCKFKDLKDSEEPCNTCLEVPAKDEYDAIPDGFEPKDEVD